MFISLCSREHQVFELQETLRYEKLLDPDLRQMNKALVRNDTLVNKVTKCLLNFDWRKDKWPDRHWRKETKMNYVNSCQLLPQEQLQGCDTCRILVYNYPLPVPCIEYTSIPIGFLKKECRPVDTESYIVTSTNSSRYPRGAKQCHVALTDFPTSHSTVLGVNLGNESDYPTYLSNVGLSSEK